MKLKERKLGTTLRYSFARNDDSLEMPNLIEVQKKSYEWFLAEGLEEVIQYIKTNCLKDNGRPAGENFTDVEFEEL
jgi:DNA-directed RNA polymerase beta subunit